jgi:hypothetical protein
MQIRARVYIVIKLIVSILLLTAVYYFTVTPPAEGDWQDQLKVLSTAEVKDNLVTIHNIRNFRYGPNEENAKQEYYDRTFDLNTLQHVWYVTEPFNGQEYAAHTFVSFEFANDQFVAISIEARKTKDQIYSPYLGLWRSYPLVYIAADERDVLLLRSNIRKDKVYVYPVKTTPEKGMLFFLSMITKMNDLAGEKREWYNTIWANCTSAIARHINAVTPGRAPFSWKTVISGYADEYALAHGLLDTDLPLDQARQKFLVTDKSIQIGDIENYSFLIRK